MSEDVMVSRRAFLGLAGGVAALATLGTTSGYGANEPKIKADDMITQEHVSDVLVIGSGMAGLFATVKAHDEGGKVIMVSKGGLGRSGQTPFAKGIFAYDASKEKMSLDEFVAKVARSALGSNNTAYTKQMAEHSLARVKELESWGFFDSPLYHKSFSKPINERRIPVLERITITHLIKEEGRIAGAAGFSLDEPTIHIFRSKSVILCTGAGGFKPNGFPIGDLTHDGTIMAYKIGAKVTGKEWNDGHPGQSKNAAACFDGWHGMFERKPSITSIQVNHHLGVDLNYMAYANGGAVRMGPPHEQGSHTLEGGPYTPEEFRMQGGPPPRPKNGEAPNGGRPPGMSEHPVGGSSAGMAIHKAEGLVPINEECASSIPGLYAAGDALGSYMAGAIYTQIGSSLAGSAVQGAIAGEAAMKYAKENRYVAIHKAFLARIKEEILAPLEREAGYSPAWVTQTLQGIMIPNFVLYIKKERMLKAALAYVEELRDHHLPYLKAADLHELRLAHETVNMVLSAEMKLKASLMRKESRCSHYRLDYPMLDDKAWQAWINIYQDKKGTMRFEKQPFGSWPAMS